MIYGWTLKTLQQVKKQVTRGLILYVSTLEVSTVTKYIKIEGRCQGQGCAMEGFGDLYSTAPKSFTAPSRV